LRYADSFDGAFADFATSSTAVDVESTVSEEDLAEPRCRRPSAGAELEITPEACPVEDGFAWECEWECPWASSSPPRTRRVFSIIKNAANPTKIPRLHER